MSSTTKTIILTAVILAAVIAGFAVIDEESDAASVQVTYHLGEASIPVSTAEDGTLVLYGPEDVSSFYTVPPGQDFVAWQTQENGGTIYQFGATVAFSAATDLYPRLVEVDQVVTFETADDSETADISEGHVAVPSIDTDREGYNFTGWLWSADGKVYASSEIADLTVSAGQTFTAQYEEIYDVAWVVDGVTIATGTTEVLDDGTVALSKPADPSKEHYTFLKWTDAAGVAYSEDYEFTAATTFTAVFEPVMLTVTFVAGEQTVATVTVPYGQTVVMPALPEGYASWDFDFAQAITESVTVQAVASTEEPSETFTVQFVVDGQVIATYASNAVTVPANPVKEGYAFQGWAIGDSVISNPATYQYTQDTVLVALFQAVEVVEHTVTFVNSSETVAEITVVDGEECTAPEAPEGMQWDPAIDLSEVSADITVNAVPLTVTVQFAVDGDVVAILTQTIPYGGTVDMDLLAGYVFPAGYDTWDADLTMPVYSDMTVNATHTPVPEEPGFFDSSVNILLVVAIVVVILALVFCYVTNQFGFRTMIRSLGKRKGGEQ